jgi:peptide/nickel transport system substrate-binding protein
LPAYAVFRQPSYAYSHYDFNVTHPAVSDPRVRQALRLAFNRQELVDSVEHGVGVVQDSATPLNAPYFVKVQTTRYDPARANALLDQAGWLRRADGIRAKNGIKLQLTVASRTGTPDIDEQLGLLSKDWQRIGVAMNVRRYPAPQMFGKDGVINGNTWDVTTFAWAADPLGDYSPIYGCGSFPPDGSNNLRWCNRKAQAAMDDLVANYDQAGRTADVKVTMREFDKDVPSIVSFMRVDLFAYNKDLKNYHPNNLTPFDNMMDVDI